MQPFLAILVLSVIGGTVYMILGPEVVKEKPPWQQQKAAPFYPAAAKTVLVAEHARNGDVGRTDDPPGFNVTLDHAQFVDQPFCRTLRQAANLLDPEGATTPPDYDCSVFSEDGNLIQNYASLTPHSKYFCFPEGRPFVWPTVGIGHQFHIPFSVDDDRSDRSGIRLETISEEPRIFRIHNFVSAEETDAMIARAKALTMERSTGGLQKEDSEATENQGDVISDRTSTNAWDLSSALAMKIKRRSFDLMRMDFKDDWSDGLQVVRYEPPQFYNSHQDWFDVNASPNWNWNPAKGGTNRFATVFLYLNDVDMGGETVFPRSTAPSEPNTEDQEEFTRLADELMPGRSNNARRLADTCREKFRVSPKRGDAILFYLQRPGGTLDTNAFHGACPIIAGEKWGANLWIWNNQAWTPQREPGYFSEDHVDKTARAAAFHNQMAQTLDILWMSSPTVGVPLGTVAAGDIYKSNTFVGHTFKFQTESGAEVASFTISKQPKQGVQEYAILGAGLTERPKPLPLPKADL